MQKFKSSHFPDSRKSLFILIQEEAWDIYAGLFGLLAMVLVFLLAYGRDFMLLAIVGVFIVIGLSSLFGVSRLKNRIAEFGVYENQFYIKSVYDIMKNEKGKFFPIPYSNFKVNKKGIQLTYFDRLVMLKASEWPDLNEMLGSLQPPPPTYYSTSTA